MRFRVLPENTLLTSVTCGYRHINRRGGSGGVGVDCRWMQGGTLPMECGAVDDVGWYNVNF